VDRRRVGRRRRPRLADPPPDDDAVDRHGRGVDQKQRAVRPAGQGPGRQRRDREAEVDRPVQVGVRAVAIARLDDVGDEGHHRRSIQIADHPEDVAGDADRHRRAQLAQHHQHRGAAEQGQDHGRAPPQAIGQDAADQTGGQHPGAVTGRDRHRGAARQAALLDQVVPEHRQDEAAGAVDQRA
jgi:hypothetical protein